MISLQKEFIYLVKSKRLTYTVILFGCSLLCIFLLLPCPIQIMISNFIKHPTIMVLILLVILAIGYFNFVSGIMLLLIFTSVLMPLSHNSQIGYIPEKRKLNLDNSYVIESFTSKKDDDDEDDDDDYVETKLTNNKTISNFFKPGYFRKKLDASNKYNEEKFSETKAKKNHLKYVEKRKKSKEKFSNTGKSDKEDFLSIEKRKFNPANEDDTNFLLALEIFKDIINRIEYKYENKKLLKKYIKNQLEEVIEMLDLVPEE